MSDHPTPVEIDAFRRGEGPRELGDHLAACPACRAEADLLARLSADQRIGTPALDAPEALDAAVSALAREHAARVRAARSKASPPRSVRALRAVAPFAAAAAVIAGISAAVLLHRDDGVPGGREPAAVATRAPTGDDVNGDGAVDILDALAIARAVEAGGSAPPLDRNRDGAVDGRDVDAIARIAVAIGPEGAR